ncbi:MAG: FtsX-like permease family protein [bacterium]
MNLIAMISLRNLFRQKRRNILLGTAISVGVTILIIAHAFSNGITDILFNKIVAYVAGHISVNFIEKSNMERQIFRDKERILSAINNNIDSANVREIDEGIGVFCRIVGNKKADSMVIVGIDLSKKLSPESMKEVQESFRMLEGNFEDLSRKDVENPAIISQEKAKYMDVKKGDILRMRFKNIYGNDESARLTIVGIVKNDNIFMQAVMFTELQNIKRLMAYRTYEVPNYVITIRNPKENAIRYADKIHSALRPDIAVLYGDMSFKSKKDAVTILGYKSNDDAKKIVNETIEIVEGEKDKIFYSKTVLVSRAIADKFGIKTGGVFEFTYKDKFENRDITRKYTASGIFNSKDMGGENVVLMQEERFYDTYYDNLPEHAGKLKGAYLPDKNNPFYKALATEWELLDRTKTSEEFEKKLKEISKKKWKGTIVDVRTMYESASDVIKMENVLNLITGSAGLILFFIILIGLVNTLRMTIRERTREIGTVRAIGMQKNDVRNSFIMESFFLALFASIIGILIAFGIMNILSKYTFETRDNPLSMLLVNGHLYFKPTFAGVLFSIIFILLIVVATAFFPARRASKLSPSSALRHYE